MLPEAIERYQIEVDGRRMAVMELGSGRPVVMVHGNPTWGFLYRKVADRLAGADIRVIMPDLFGLGFSDHIAASEHTVANHARWLAEAIDVLELKNLVAVVQDWGGPIGTLATHDSQAKVDALVVLNTGLGPPKPGFKPTLFHRVSHVPVVSELLFRGLGFPQIYLASAQADKTSIRGKVSRAYRYPLRNRVRNHAPLALARMVPDGQDHPSVPEMRRCQEIYEGFQGPIALVWGKRDPILGRLLGRLSRQRPDARVTETEAGHFLQEEVPDEIAEAIRWALAESA